MLIEYYIIGCCLLVWIGITIWTIRYALSKWPALFFTPAEARITDTRIVEEYGISSSDGPDNRVSSVLKLSYAFKVDGRVYVGYDEGGSFERKKGERPLYLGKKKAGDTIVVYYNPKNPSESTHRRFAFFGGLVYLGLGQLFLLLAIHLINTWLN